MYQTTDGKVISELEPCHVPHNIRSNAGFPETVYIDTRSTMVLHSLLPKKPDSSYELQKE
jgi:hypothetical protein